MNTLSDVKTLSEQPRFGSSLMTRKGHLTSKDEIKAIYEFAIEHELKQTPSLCVY